MKLLGQYLVEMKYTISNFEHNFGVAPQLLKLFGSVLIVWSYVGLLEYDADP